MVNEWDVDEMQNVKTEQNVLSNKFYREFVLTHWIKLSMPIRAKLGVLLMTVSAKFKKK